MTNINITIICIYIHIFFLHSLDRNSNVEIKFFFFETHTICAYTFYPQKTYFHFHQYCTPFHFWVTISFLKLIIYYKTKKYSAFTVSLQNVHNNFKSIYKTVRFFFINYQMYMKIAQFLGYLTRNSVYWINYECKIRVHLRGARNILNLNIPNCCTWTAVRTS